MRLSFLANAVVGVMLACATVRAESVTVNPQVTGKGVVLGGGTVESGSQITLRAVAQVDWRFDHWEGLPSGQSQENPITLTAAAGLQPTAVMVVSQAAGRFAGAPVAGIASYIEAGYSRTNVPAGLEAIAISAGGPNSLALKADGTVVSWNIDQTNQFAVPAGVSDVVNIDAGIWHNIVAKADGTVVAWNTARVFEIPAGLSNVVAVAAGGNHSVALKDDGFVVDWGTNGIVQPVPAGLRDVIGIAAGEAYGLALKADGSVVGWGQIRPLGGDYAPAVPPASFSNLVAISTCYDYNLGLRVDGTIAEWGTLAGMPSGMPAGLTNIAQIGAGLERMVAVSTNGIMTGWGRPGLDTGVSGVSNIISAEPAGRSYLVIRGEGFGFIRADRRTVLVEEGQAIRLTPVTTGGEIYQWFRNGQPVVGANSPSFFSAGVSAADAGTYSLVVIKGDNAFATPPTAVTVIAAGYPRVLVNGAEVREATRLTGQAQITLTTTLAGAQIFYTVDGSTPTFSSTRYTAPFTLNQTTNVLIRALAISGDLTKEATNTAVRIDVLPSYTLSVTITGPGRVEVTPKLTRYLQGDVVRLEAIPNANATFVRWANMLSGTNPVQEIVMNSNWTVEAVFQDAPKYAATISGGGGTTAINPPGPQYAGTDVTITTTPNAGWRFRNWSGDHTGTEPSFVWHVEGPAAFRANFDTVITTTATGPGRIVLEPNSPRYLYGTQVRVIPEPEFGNELVLWGQDAAGKPLTEWTLTVTNAMPEISALFRATSPPAYEASEVRIENGQLTMAVRGSAGTTVIVQATEDFVTWTDVKTITIPTSGARDESVAAIPVGETRQFYRLKQTQ
jgi:trimeric autotransporter adhesin